ncbi:preprotein translocase subunit YajC [Wenyingzhuangia sp. 2_MG-2023]|uniref:preprotein translocase subunit YajC n=1 Tax=Wenyingzhuangia sp. 2_MG-2023 TaxID=3062639 RepID=UPI0026E4532F|nr:preprotein translocase subunit YajC [Wenyingzhuangia sp. 2_MG-2023]MDO6739141.1 preprotein translocase subunit YajC [Wenyingzhuangia sp. 2_MG-2023]MDO6803630.1 preprotein translocase subunit YajC [Wenyingzhuangia sp. 1_MG-2023]
MIALQESPMSPIFLIVMAIFVVFFMIIPQVRKSKNEKKFKASLTKGTKVVTTGGIHGKLLEINEGTVMIETNAGKLLLEKSALNMELTKQYNAPATPEKKK